MIKERPILFSAPMVRAILEGRKTVTRRVVKPQPANGWRFTGGFGRITSKHQNKDRFGVFIRRGEHTDFPEMDIVPCPYGSPGDRLWVRETWGVFDQGFDTAEESSLVVYRADFDAPQPKRWRPSIHMFRADSRIMLEITDVRVERLQDISEEQAQAEGVCYDRIARAYFPSDEGGPASKCECAAFRNLWQSINGPGSWDANPYVWAVSFKVIQPPQEHHHD